MTRLLALLLTLTLVASIALPGDAVSRCAAASTVTTCCAVSVQPDLTACCCLEHPAPVPATLPIIDRHWLAEKAAEPLIASVATLWTYTPADVPAGIWRAPPILPFAGAPPPRERFCITLI